MHILPEFANFSAARGQAINIPNTKRKGGAKMAKRAWTFLKSKKNFIIFFSLYTAAFVLIVRFIFHLLPVLLGALLGWAAAPLCRMLEQRLHLSPKRAALCTAVSVYAVLLILLALLFTRLIQESAAFFASGQYFRYEALAPAVRSFLEHTWSKLPRWIDTAQKNFSGDISAALPALQGTVKAVLLLPTVFLTLALIPVFAYLTLRFRPVLTKLFAKLIGEKCAENLQKSVKSESSVGFVSAYALIYAITFTESFVMLHLLRMEYPLMTAVVVTVSDIFPVLGPGTVLLPLAVYRLLCGSAAQALGLFIGWIILSVIRQIIEPKLLAKMTRTPPAVMLFAVYCSLISSNFWLIPYTGTFFMLLGMLKKAGILTDNSRNNIN